MGHDDDDDSIPATQPVRTLLLDGVVAYVEVRSGHDNRSRGVKTQLRNLGASVVDTLTKDVTHVVFNEGLPSTYKKAKKMKCHLVSVLWIEACKEGLAKVCEAGYPPIGQQLYENPQSLKNFKKMKSMQPDFDDEVAIMKTNKVRKTIQRRKPKLSEPNKDKGNVDGEVNKSPSDSNQTNTVNHTKGPATKRSSRTSANKKSENKVALKEINPVVMNISAACNEPRGKSGTITVEKNFATEESSNETLQKEDSSSSVIFCGVVEDEPSTSTARRKMKSSNKSSVKDISRAEFVQGLSTVVRSLSEDKQKWMPSEISPWRRRLYETDKEVLPPSKVNKKNILSPNKPPLPRRSPRQSSEQEKLAKKSLRVTASASAALVQKQKMPPPPSPGDDYMLLSQEPGDMPSLDELARMKKGSVNVGGAPITLSQIVRSYDAVAQRQSSSLSSVAQKSKSLTQPQVSDESLQGSNKAEHNGQQSLIFVEDALCDEEVVQHAGSDAGSTMSSVSTRVLINGMAPERSNISSTNILPGSEETECSASLLSLSAPSTLEDGDVEKFGREPSPVFIIKKAKFRRPMKKVEATDKKVECPSTSSDFHIDGNSLQDEPEGSTKEEITNSTSDKANKNRGSLNPMDYINKIFLPRFLLSSKTPQNTQTNNVLVEETPDTVCKANNETESIVIPPTPAVEMECEETNTIVSPTQSITSSVFSWMKESCRITTFSPRPKKQLKTPNNKQPILDTVSKSAQQVSNETVDATQVTSVEAINKSGSVKSVAQPSSLRKVHKDQKIIPETQSKNPEDATVSSHTPQIVRKSTRKLQSLSPTKSVKKKRNMKRKDSGDNISNSNSPSILLGEKSEEIPVPKTRRRRKVVCSIEPNNCETTTNKSEKISGCSPKESPAVINKNTKQDSTSGYDTSNSQASILNKSPKKTLRDLSSKRKRVSDIISPIPSPTKKRSEVYETSTAQTLDETEDTDSSSKTSGRKRTKSEPTSDNKRMKLNSSEPSMPAKTKRASRADSSSLLETRSQSDLSMESSKSSGRKSSEVAKKRLAKSLTRSNMSNTPKVIVCTFLTTSEQNGIDIAGESLDRWKLEKKVTSRTTHVINSGPKRTLNMLKGMARGCWLVDQKWMLDSAKAGHWLEEEKYELTKFSPAVRQCRIKQQAMGKQFKHDLFSKVGAIYISPKTENPPAKEVREILDLCSAEIVASHKEAKIIIGVTMNHKGSFHCVNARWVLDSVTKNKILSVNDPCFQIE